MHANIITDIATRSDIGPRHTQEDRVTAVAQPDGSWVIAVADGLGGHPFGDEAAQAAVDALPERIASTDEMAAAFDAANTAVWALHPEMRSTNEELSSVIALTTLVVAAWTPEQGLLVSWIGDSMAFLVPVGSGPGWHSTPHGDRFGFISRCIGMYRTDRDSCGLPQGHVDHLSDDVPRARIDEWINDTGLLVVLATDGLFGPVLTAHDRDWFSDDPHDLSVGFALPSDRRNSADDAAHTLIETVRIEGHIDNTTIAVALVHPSGASSAEREAPGSCTRTPEEF